MGTETIVIGLQTPQKSKVSPWRQYKGDIQEYLEKGPWEKKIILYEFIRSSSQQKLSSFLIKENSNIIMFWKSKPSQFQESWR